MCEVRDVTALVRRCERLILKGSGPAQPVELLEEWEKAAEALPLLLEAYDRATDSDVDPADPTLLNRIYLLARLMTRPERYYPDERFDQRDIMRLYQIATLARLVSCSMQEVFCDQSVREVEGQLFRMLDGKVYAVQVIHSQVGASCSLCSNCDEPVGYCATQCPNCGFPFLGPALSVEFAKWGDMDVSARQQLAQQIFQRPDHGNL